MHAEIFSLRGQLMQAAALQCSSKECVQRVQMVTETEDEFMRTINLLVIHCSATRADRDFTEDDLEVCHRRRGFNGTGYHFYIRKNGDIKTTREIERIGAHAKGHNQNSIGICYEGGLDCHGHPADTRTEWQVHSMHVLFLRSCVIIPAAGCADIGI